jgi:hypothetical protein
MTGSRYILTFIDHFSRYSWVYFLNTKSETFEVFKQWRAQVEKETHKKLSCLRTDRGGEYLSFEFQHYCKLHGIRRQLTAAGTPQQNGMAERKNRYLLETTRSLLFGAHLPTYLWEEAVKTACYLSNRVPTRALYKITPFEVYTGQRPNLAHLKVFGSAAFIHVQDRKKLDPKSRQLVFVGYDLQTKGYRCLDFLTKKIVISRDVIFNKNKLGIPSMRDLPSSADDILKAFFDLNTPIPVVSSSPELNPAPVTEIHIQPTSELPSVSPSDSPSPSYPFPPEPDRHPELHPETQTDSSGLRRSSRFRRQNVRLDDYVLSISVDDFDLCLAEVAPPLSSNNLTFDQAAHHQGWKEAMEDEMNSILKNHTWDLVSLPIGKKAISSKWVYKTKPGLNGENDKLKARLVARGFEQQYGVDFEETFAHVVKWSTIRALTARAAQLGHAIHHLDVKTAFLYGKITDDIYMAQPLGFTVSGKENLVCKMNRALYGLMQSPRMWYERIDTYLRSLGLTRSSSDYNMYYLGTGPYKVVLVLYVDDLFLSGGDEQKISWLKEQLHTQFDMTDLGLVSKYLGVEFRRLTDGSYHLTQQSYAEDILKEFGMLQSKPEHVPLPPGLQLMSDMNSEPADLHHYCKLVGKLIFLTTTRPDLSYAVSTVSRYMSAPQQAHLEVVKHILRYLKKTCDYGILYQSQGKHPIRGYTDVDWAACPETRRPTGGYLFSLAGGSITWQSKCQMTVSRSSTESEYVALSTCSQEAVWLGRLLAEFGMTSSTAIPLAHPSSTCQSNLQYAIPIPVSCNNQSSIKLAKNPVFHVRTKHIEVCHHFVRECALRGEIQLDYISTDINPADILTKALPRPKFEKHRTNLGLVSLTDLCPKL